MFYFVQNLYILLCLPPLLLLFSTIILFGNISVLQDCYEIDVPLFTTVL